jgi:hypothetical protein
MDAPIPFDFVTYLRNASTLPGPAKEEVPCVARVLAKPGPPDYNAGLKDRNPVPSMAEKHAWEDANDCRRWRFFQAVEH